MSLLKDIYYQRKYLSLYLEQGEEIFEFKYEVGECFLYNISIKRPIYKIGKEKINDGFNDLETAYGYGGFYTNCDDENFLNEAFGKYIEKCVEEKVIAEFIRFHVFNGFPLKHPNFLNMQIYDRDVCCVDLSKSIEERWKKYSSKTRNILRKCEKDKLIFTESKDIEKFMNLYEQTMKKNNASDFYFFDRKYFQDLLNLDNVKLFAIEKNGGVISSSFFMFSNIFGHYHLSANDYSMRKYNANYYMLDQIFNVAKKNRKKYFILGGGRTNSGNDSLLKFKLKFANFTKPFYIGGKIYNRDIYNKYIKLWEGQTDKDVNYFLKYRLEV